MLQPGTCYARPIYPQNNARHFYEVYFEVLYKLTHARKHARTGASWRTNPLERSTHAAPAHEPLVLPIKKKGKDGSSKIFANAASFVSFSISLSRSCCGVQLEPLVLPIKRKGKDGSSKISAIAASLVSFSISLSRSCCGVQLFLDDEDRCSGPM